MKTGLRGAVAALAGGCVLASATAVAADPVVSPAPVLTSTALDAAARMVAGYKRRDKLDAPPTFAEFAGRTFRLEGQLEDINERISGGAGSWSYDPSKNTLELAVGTGLIRARDIDLYSAGLAFDHQFEKAFVASYSRRRTGAHRASNAFGVTAMVADYAEWRVAVAVFSRGMPGVLAAGQLPAGPGYSVSLNAAPDQARALVRDLRVVVEGTVTPLDRRSIICSESYNDATLDEPEETRITTCVLPAGIRRIAIENRASGQIVREWMTSDASPDPIAASQ